MSKEEIIPLLEKKKEMTPEEIARKLKISQRAVFFNLFRMLKAGEVERRKLSKEEVLKKRGDRWYNGRQFVYRLAESR